MMFRCRHVAPKSSRWQAAVLIFLIASADSGVEALREHALRGDVAGRITSSADEALSKAMRAVERAESAAQAAGVRHNRALLAADSFADAALDSKAVVGADAAGGATSRVGEPFIAGAIIILTLASMIMKAVTATKRATFQMMQGKYSEQMHLLLDETNAAVAQINDRFDDVFGEVTRQMSDLVRDVGVAAVQLLSNDRVLSAAEHAVKRIDAALQPPATTASEEEVSLWHRYTSSPHINKLKDAHGKVQTALATAKGMKPVPPIPDALMGELRAALAKVVAGDYAVIHSAGQLSAKASFDASKLGKYVYLVDPAAMQKVFSLVLTSSSGAPLRAMTEDEVRVEGLMRRMSHAATMRTLSKGRGGESSLDAGLMAEQRSATLAIRNIKAQGSVKQGLSAQEKETEGGTGDTIVEVNEDIASIVDMAEQGNDILQAFSDAGGAEALAALKLNPELIGTVVQSLQLVGAIVSVIASSMTIYRLNKDAEIAEFEFARASGIAGERHILAVRRATAATCRLMDSLRAPLKDVINGRALDLLKGEQGSPQFWKALGLPLTLKDVTDPQGSKDVQLLSDNARKRISVTVATRFCGIFSPMLARMEELFSPAGECVVRLQATAPQPDKDLLALTGAEDVSAQAKVRATAQQVLGLPKAPSLSGGDFSLPRVETCIDADIYDIAIAGDDGTAKELKALGYVRMGDIDANWAAKGDKFLTFGGDLNRHLVEPKKAADELTGWAHTNQMTTVYILTCKALHTTAKAQVDAAQANPKIKPAVDKILAFFALLKFPVTDVTFAVRYPDEVEDHKSAQAKLQAAGYQMLHISDAGLTADDLAFNFAAELKGRAAADSKYATCKKHNVRRGIRENKALVTMHVLRGGVTPLVDMRLAPFVSVSSVAGGLMSSSAAGALAESFVMRNQKALAAATVKPLPSSQTMGTRWYATGKFAAGSNGPAFAQDKAVSMIAPPTCTDSWDTVTRVDAKWKKQSLFQMLLNREGKEADVTFYKHSFNPRCAVDANGKSVWERVAVSPFPDNDRKEAVAQKPYLWLHRRYAIPSFTPLLEEVASCPWECADALKGVILPPAALYASPTSLQQLHKNFAIDADIKV